MNNCRLDTLLNSSLIAVGLFGLLVAVMDGPTPEAAQVVGGLVVSEGTA